jgi:hypothetical protein
MTYLMLPIDTKVSDVSIDKMAQPQSQSQQSMGIPAYAQPASARRTVKRSRNQTPNVTTRTILQSRSSVPAYERY